MGDRTAFFYGTLMAPEILHRVIYGTPSPANDPIMAPLAASLNIVPAILKGYCRHRVKYAEYPGIIPQAGHTVKGTFVTGLTEGDIWRLDKFEGDEYERVDVEVMLEGGEEKRTAETYIYTAGEDALEKSEWDYEEFRREKLRNWTGSSREYEDLDRAEAVLRQQIEEGRASLAIDSPAFGASAQAEKKEEEILLSAV